MAASLPLNATSVFPSLNYPFVRHGSRRSVVQSTTGMVACTQPLAAEAGQRILRMGGNAADAAVATIAALSVTEPTSCGIGGDMFCLFYNAKTKQIHALNGSGRSAKNTTVEQVRKDLDVPDGVAGEIPPTSAWSVTVPGAAAGWIDTVEKYGSGKLSLEQIFTPAIDLAENGFAVGEVASFLWQVAEERIKAASPNFRDILKRDRHSELFCRAPRPGEVMKMPKLAETFRTVAREGKKGFYTGRIAKSIVDMVGQLGGHLTVEDLEQHMNAGPVETKPISLKFHRNPDPSSESDGKSVELWEFPPNGQGIVTLIALGILKELRKTGVVSLDESDHNTPFYLHTVIECLRIAFADARWWVTDPDHSTVTTEHLLSPAYLAERAKLFDPQGRSDHAPGKHGHERSPAQNHSDTVYFAVTDKEGNGMSFICSLYTEMGSCIVPDGCGFALHARAGNFVLGPKDHPNIYAGGKRPYHTIIPAITTVGEEPDRELHSVFGVMGAFMQPQGQLQVLLNQQLFGMNPQQALDAPRFCIGAGLDYDNVPTVFLEEGIPETTMQALTKMGHSVEMVTGFERRHFGRGQIIRRHVDTEYGTVVWSGGSDLRGDGCALPA